MMEKIARKLHGEEEGFTLIELMVVVLIIGILIAIALPTFLGQRTKAQNRAAQSSLRNAVAGAKTVFTDNDVYPVTATMVTNMAAVEPSLQYQSTASAAPNTVSVAVNTAASNGAAIGQVAGLASMSDSGTCYLMVDYEAAPTSPNTAGVHYGNTTTAANCTGAQALTLAPSLATDTPGEGGW